MGHTHIYAFFSHWVFGKGQELVCFFGSIDFDLDAAENYVVSFYQIFKAFFCIFDAFLMIFLFFYLPKNKSAKKAKKKKKHKMHYKKCEKHIKRTFKNALQKCIKSKLTA